jgi:hypothetical protein
MKIKKFRIEYDTDYGIDHRFGWTISINGFIWAELEPNLFVAMLKAYRAWKDFLKDTQDNA